MAFLESKHITIAHNTLTLFALAHHKDEQFVYSTLFMFIITHKQFLPVARWFVAQAETKEAAHLHRIITKPNTVSDWMPLLPVGFNPADHNQAFHPFSLKLLEYCFIKLANPRFARSPSDTICVLLAGERGIWSRLCGAHDSLDAGNRREARSAVGQAITIQQEQQDNFTALQSLSTHWLETSTDTLQELLSVQIAASKERETRLISCGKISHPGMMTYLLSQLSAGLFNRPDAEHITTSRLLKEAYQHALTAPVSTESFKI